MEFDTNTILFYVRPANRPQLEAAEAEAVQSAHLEHLGEMGRQGHLLSAGPFGEQTDESMRGLAVLTVTPERALELFAQDPAVIAGQLRVEVAVWYRPKGQATFNFVEPTYD
jgi:uncharacterized protein YciI